MAIATWHRTGQEGLHNGVNHIEYELLDEEGQQIPLDEDHVTSIKRTVYHWYQTIKQPYGSR